MKIKSLPLIATRGFSLPLLRVMWCALLALAGASATQNLQAASQTWTNAPVDNTWTNVNNWVGLGAPGVINPAASGLSANVATFTNAIPINGIGGAIDPITNDAARNFGGYLFDTATCGAYFFVNRINDNYIDLTQGNNIQVGPAEPSPIVFNQSVRVRLPSSTNGRYDITNNATSPTATVFLTAITNTSASTRPLSLYLNGSNTGTNTIVRIDDGINTSGAIQIFKEGTGLWILSGPNDIAQKTSASVPAGIFVEGGTLEVQDPGALGTITAANFYVTNSTLQIDNVTLANAGITLRNAGIIRMNGVGTVNGVTMSTLAANNGTLATTRPTDVMTVGNAADTLTGGAVDSVLHIAGPGTVLFPNSDNYLGKVSVDSGTNQLSAIGGFGAGPNLNVSAGGVFDITPLGASDYIIDTKAFSANGAGTAVGTTAATVMADPAGTIDFASKALTLTFTPTSFTGDSGHPALYCSRGILSFSGNAITVNNASGTPLGAGSYQLVSQATGSIVTSGGFVVLVSGSGLGAGLIAEISAVGGNLNLVVSAYTPKSLVWIGNDPINPGVWDRQTSTNWLAGATPVTFNIYDSVTFNTTGSAQPIVNLAGTMQPSSVTVDTSANNYTFTGAGQIAGGTSLVKINTGGTLILQTANTYSGGTIISNGVVQLGINEGVSSTGPVGANDITIYSPAVFDLNGFVNTVNGLNGSGIIDDVAGGGTSTLNIGLNNDSGVFTGVIKNTSGALGIFKTGTGTETLTASNTFVGPTTIDTGTLRVTNMYALGAGYSPVTINSGTLDMQTSLLLTNLNGAGGFVINSSAFTNTLTITSNSTFSGIIAGKIGILVNGGTLRLNGVNTYSNGTIVAANAGFGHRQRGGQRWNCRNHCQQ